MATATVPWPAGGSPARPLGTGNKEQVEGGEIRERGRGQIRQDHAGGTDKFRFYLPFCCVDWMKEKSKKK